MPEFSLDMHRAKHALDCIRAVKALQDSDDKDQRKRGAHYGSYAKALPASILQVGLGQALATLLAKAKGKETASLLLYQHMQNWLHQTDGDHRPYPKSSAADLLDAIVAGDEDQYLRAQAEAMAYLTWLKKFATAQLDDERAQPGDSTAPATNTESGS